MKAIRNYVFFRVLFCCIFFLTIFSSPLMIIPLDFEWLEVSKINNELISIDPKSIKYKNRGFLTVIAKYSEIDSDMHTVTNNDTFLMAIDCGRRLYNKFPANTDLKQVKNWKNPINNKLLKKTIIASCSY